MNFPVFDLHCDTVSKLVAYETGGGMPLLHNDQHIDLERAGKLPGYAQCFAFWTTTDMRLPKGWKVTDLFWREVSTLQEQLDKNSGIIRQARSAADVRRNYEQGLMSAFFTLEGPAGIEFDPGKLE